MSRPRELDTLLAQVAEALAGPDADGKRAAIVRAAAELFLREGYGGAGMDAIAREAGVAKQTVYSHFGSKPALFKALLTHLCLRVIPEDAFDRALALPAREGLAEFGRQFLGGILSARAVAIYRTVIAESHRSPEVGLMFYSAGPTRVKAVLRGYLERLDREGTLRIPDVPLATDVFLGMLLGPFHVEKTLGVSGPATAAQIAAAVDEAVRVFVRAYGAA